MVGSVAWQEGRPSIHAHGVAAGRDFRAFAGHLLALEVSTGSVEITLVTCEQRLQRELDSCTGANVLRLHPDSRHGGSVTDLKLLQLVVDLVEAGSLSKVCAARGIAQSALSKQIAGLERDFGAKLFHRTGRGLALTEFGQSIMPRRVQRSFRGRDCWQTRFGRTPGCLAGLSDWRCKRRSLNSLWARYFRECAGTIPQIELRLMEGFSGNIEEWLASGKADVGVLSRYGGVHAARTDEALNAADLYLVAPAGDLLTSRPQVDFAELAHLPLVLPGLPDGLRLMLAETSKKSETPINVAVEVDSLTAMKEIVAGGSGYTILTRQAVHFEVAQKRLQVSLIVNPTLSRTLVLSTSVHRPMTLASRAVGSLIRDIGRELDQVDL